MALSKPLSTYDIALAIHASSLDVGTLCTSPLVSPWARYKPFRNSALDFASDSAYEAARVAANYGIGIPSAQGTSAPNTLLTTAKTFGVPDWNWSSVGRAWNPAAPRGKDGGGVGINEWYRMFDFVGYEAENFPFHGSAVTVEGAMKYKIDVYGRHVKRAPNLPMVRPTALTESDLTASVGRWQTRYIGIVYRPQGSTTGWECKSFLASSIPYTITISGLAAGTVYDAAFFICGKALSSKDDITSSDWFYLAPYPYFTLGDYQDFGFEPSVIGNAAVFPTSIALTLGYKCQTSSEYRRISEVKLCHRASTHYTQVSGNRYQITKLKSGVVADNEDDVVIYNSNPLMVPPADSVQNFPPPQGGLAPLNTFTLNIDPSKVNEGATFLVFRHQHFINNEWVDDVQGADGNAETTTLTGGGLYAIRLTYRLPSDPV